MAIVIPVKETRCLLKNLLLLDLLPFLVGDHILFALLHRQLKCRFNLCHRATLSFYKTTYKATQKRSPKPKPGASFSISKIFPLGQHDDIGRLRPFWALGNFELDFIALIENLEPILLN